MQGCVPEYSVIYFMIQQFYSWLMINPAITWLVFWKLDSNLLLDQAFPVLLYNSWAERGNFLIFNTSI